MIICLVLIASALESGPERTTAYPEICAVPAIIANPEAPISGNIPEIPDNGPTGEQCERDPNSDPRCKFG